MSPDWPDVSETACPACSQVSLEIVERFEAKPVGTWSLAGMQMKMTGTMWPWLVCRSCGVEARGKVE